MKFIPLFLLFVASAAVAQTSYVPPTKVLLKKGYQLGVTGDYFKSSKSIDKDGKDVEFLDGESFSRTQGEVEGRYGLTNELQLSGGVRFRQNASKMINAGGEVEDETSTGVQSTFLSLMYAFKPVDRFIYAVEGTFRYTPYTNEETTSTQRGTMVLGDDGNEYTVGAAVTYASRTNNYLTLRGGYRNPGKDLATELYWQAEAALAWKYVALIAGVDGSSSMNNDPYEDKPLEKPNYYTGRTALYNSSNREWMAPYAGLNLALGESWRVEARGSQVVSGKSTDLGTSFSLALIRRVDGKKTSSPDKRFKDYDFEGTITKVSPKKGYVVIDRGLSSDVQKGMKIDFFDFDYVGGNILLARGTVIQAKSETSIVKITQLYNTKKELKEGVVARGFFR
ncbi:hypothetical protein [Peredibacter starrii]|uniref:Porin n=1 Tax=Peredibacter starrii TaxID=28202 RepID=A0AAX4HTV3_9BACT|nr:hypothetical protein [Peredibacter starrii]WPU66339.1 hypothetical protein SOO65_06225 [Peredibacter starrii]